MAVMKAAFFSQGAAGILKARAVEDQLYRSRGRPGLFGAATSETARTNDRLAVGWIVSYEAAIGDRGRVAKNVLVEDAGG